MLMLNVYHLRNIACLHFQTNAEKLVHAVVVLSLLQYNKFCCQGPQLYKLFCSYHGLEQYS